MKIIISENSKLNEKLLKMEKDYKTKFDKLDSKILELSEVNKKILSQLKEKSKENEKVIFCLFSFKMI